MLLEGVIAMLQAGPQGHEFTQLYNLGNYENYGDARSAEEKLRAIVSARFDDPEIVEAVLANSGLRQPAVRQSRSVSRQPDEGAPAKSRQKARHQVRVPEAYEPFPLSCLPHALRAFVANASASMGCDEAFVAIPALVACAAAVGNTRIIEVKRGWQEPSILWCAVVGESGTLKTPAINAAMRPLQDAQAKGMRSYKDELKAWDKKKSQYVKAHAVRRREKGNKPPPAEPKRPAMPRLLTSDCTVEALADLLEENPRGVLLQRDELSGWFDSFDRYARGRGDAPTFLSMYNAQSIVVDRKTGKRQIIVERASLSVVGGIQPSVLRRVLGEEHLANGLAARLLMACPPRVPRHWRDQVTDAGVVARYAGTVESLLNLAPAIRRENRTFDPVVIRLTPEAKAVFAAFVNKLGQEQLEYHGHVAAMFSKIEGYAARFALLLHLLHQVEDPELDDFVDQRTMANGIRLALWFRDQALRCYRMLEESSDDAEARELLDLIRRRGGFITVRELMHARRKYRGSAPDAREALDRLADAGLGTWNHQAPGSDGGRPMSRFELHNHGRSR